MLDLDREATKRFKRSTSDDICVLHINLKTGIGRPPDLCSRGICSNTIVPKCLRLYCLYFTSKHPPVNSDKL